MFALNLPKIYSSKWMIQRRCYISLYRRTNNNIMLNMNESSSYMEANITKEIILSHPPPTTTHNIIIVWDICCKEKNKYWQTSTVTEHDTYITDHRGPVVDKQTSIPPGDLGLRDGGDGANQCHVFTLDNFLIGRSWRDLRSTRQLRAREVLQ